MRHPEHEQFLEEDWLFEAITETYIPLISLFEGLVKDGADFRITLSFSPTLVSMLMDPLLQERYARHISKLIELAENEIERTRSQPEFLSLARMYRELFSHARSVFEETCKRNLIEAFKEFQELGKAELITSAATHAFLPLIKNRNAVRAQIMVAVEQHKQYFGRSPKGIWLPECGYYEGLDGLLKEAGIHYFFTEAHGLFHASPRPRYGVYAPLSCPSGLHAFGRDIESSKQVWSSREGYPGDPAYRDFYRDIGFDLDYDYIRPYLHTGGERVHLGIKYYRITGPGDEKMPYVRDRALEKAAEHARDFLSSREHQIEWLHRAFKGRRPVVVAPYDAELFGHWWFEGPAWLDFLIRRLAIDTNVVRLITPGEYLAEHPRCQDASPSESSWGHGGYAEVWLDGSNDWIYRHLHMAEDRMVALARRSPAADSVLRRALNQAARELLLAQSSDWAFIMKTGSHAEYAAGRVKEHLINFTKLYESIVGNTVDEERLGTLEYKNNIFPEIDYRVYA